MTMQTWEVLERAADKIERDGWCQGMYYGHGRSSCVLGAIRCANRSDNHNTEEVRAFAKAVAQDASIFLHSVIPHYNDTPGRTAAEVIAMLRAVAASEKARAQQTEPARERATA